MASSNIPPEIITEILYRLPVKSLGRFRCVSKGFLSLLSEPRFIKTHQNTLNRRHLIILELGSLHSQHLFHDNVLGPKRLCLRFPNVGVFGGSCNGLVLVTVKPCGLGSDILVVLNPVTKEFVELPGSDLIGNAIVHGFGYDSITDDYKVVTICYIYNNEFVNFRRRDLLVHVYSLKTNTWRLVSDFPYSTDYHECFPPVFVNGRLHWRAVTRSDHNTQVIVAFSLADETLSEVPLPDACKDASFTIVPGEKLVILTAKSEVWLMNEYGVRESWSNILLDKYPTYIGFSYNDKLVAAFYDGVAMYDIEQGSLCKPIHTYPYQQGWSFKIVGICVESLVSPKVNGLEPVGRARSRLYAPLPNQGRAMVTLCSVMPRLSEFLMFLVVVWLIGLMLYLVANTALTISNDQLESQGGQ